MTTAADQITALEMARNLVTQIARRADQSQRDPLGALVHRTGEYGHVAAQLAANLATVSIAEDMHRIVAIMTGEAAALLDQQWTREAEGHSGAVDDARATREHMREWGAGTEDHPGEVP